MKLSEHVEKIRLLIDTAFRGKLGRMGIQNSTILPFNSESESIRDERQKLEKIFNILKSETGSHIKAYEKLVEELTFTLFNRLAAIKVLEAHTLIPDIITRKSLHGGRSFSHLLWLEEHPEMRETELEGISMFLEDKMRDLSSEIEIFNLDYPFNFFPTAIEINNIFKTLNDLDNDLDLRKEIWKSDDILGWMYESYNNNKRDAFKASGVKTEYDKVSIQSQVYTPHWVVKFLVDNSLGKLYLEMYPDSGIKSKYKIANAPNKITRERKPLTELKIIDPVTGSGNFLLYGFDLFYDLYVDQIDNYGNPQNYDIDKIPELIIANNLHGIDLDDRAIQLAQLGLYIKAKRKKSSTKIDHFNIVSSDFFLPDYNEVKHLFYNDEPLDNELEKIVTDIWADLQQAFKFGSLIRLEEKFDSHVHRIVAQFEATQPSFFSEPRLTSYEQFRENFFKNLQRAVAQNTAKQGITFLNTKTQDAISFLHLLTQKYDVAVANPPYTDSADFGPNLKNFIDTNYKQPYKFNSNLYTSFIKRCCELVNEEGSIGLIHPHTFMFIKTFEDVRRYIIEKTHITLLVDYGLDRVNLFGPGILLDATLYILSKKNSKDEGVYFNITFNQQEKFKQQSLSQTFDDYLNNQKNDRVYLLSQEKIKIITGWPFIYWISDVFREKFKEKAFEKYFYICNGISSGGNNERFYRFLWEVNKNDISIDYKNDKKKWVRINKGGGFNKWYGNLSLLFEWGNNGKQLKELKKTIPSIRHGYEEFYFEEGLAFTGASSKGLSVRYQPYNCIFERAGKSIFKKKKEMDYYYTLAFLNSTLCGYIIDALNPTVSFQSGDIERIPFLVPEKEIQKLISELSIQNVSVKENLSCFAITEFNFNKNPLNYYSENLLKDRLLTYFNYENLELTKILLNEAIINHLVFRIYDISSEEIKKIEDKMGKSIGDLPILRSARQEFISLLNENDEIVKHHIEKLPETQIDEQNIKVLTEEFCALYQSNNDLEEFCIRSQLNPINVWYLFKQSKILPEAKAEEIAMEFIADKLRVILTEDENGIIPLVGFSGEVGLLERLEEKCINEGLTSAQFAQIEQFFKKSLKMYLETNFFKNLSDHLNLFMYLPKTPFIWHLSSGEHQGFEAYIIIYKWNRDSLYKLKSTYISERSDALQYRFDELKNNNSPASQVEKEKIQLQQLEIEKFVKKIDELIDENYNPKLDDGVGKNIAPLQKKGMLKADVLNKKQLEKYLNADW